MSCAPRSTNSPVGASAQKAGAADIRELRTLVERMDKAAARDELDAYYRANLQFHDRLVELAGNAKLLATYRRLVNELHLYRRAALAQAGALPISTREHHDIVEKIATGQAAAAGRALYDHVMGSRERMHRVQDTPAPSPKPARCPRGDGHDRARPLRQRQRPHLSLAGATAGRRLRRRLRTRLHHAGHLGRARAVPGVAARSAAPA